MNDSDANLPPSKSQRKRDMHLLQKLGEELVALPLSQLQNIPLPDDLASAINEARKITSFGAKKRQLQYIGRLMRNVDPEPIQQALLAIKNQAHKSINQFHQLEQWRDWLIDEGVSLIDAAVLAFPGIDRQRLRQLIRNAQNEAKTDAPGVHARSLFRYLQEIGTPHSNPPPQEGRESKK